MIIGLKDSHALFKHHSCLRNHFLWHSVPRNADVCHMILGSAIHTSKEMPRFRRSKQLQHKVPMHAGTDRLCSFAGDSAE
jgi:hypothetical protein